MNVAPGTTDEQRTKADVYSVSQRRSKPFVGGMWRVINMSKFKTMIANEKEFDRSLEKLDELYEEGKSLIVRLLPPEEFGEDYDAERLYELLKEMRDLSAVNMQKLHFKIEN